MPGEMITVFRGATVEEADVVAHWLEDNGIAAFVANRLSAAYVPIVSTLRGVEVCVADEEDAEKAKALLAERRDEIARRGSAQPGRGPITVFCEECGSPASFPANLAGTVQNCPTCRAHIDVAED
jgi:hypothetical protein